ncbi:MAG: hypothetical protein JSW61_04170 [Candidatus Thorarchaeota archaeon]|nr:MAG: hypothetical protein JSW61_04170 [Candidatus Thorarchaeota archaeon]
MRTEIERFPSPYREDILNIWNDWLDTDPVPPYYLSWSEFSSQRDDSEALYTETRVYLKRVRNEIRNHELPMTLWQKVAKGLAAIASVFLVIFLALSRVARGSD